ncbi:MAG: cobalamin-dependent protein, partial [Lachnospiraceae bacterium]|nr:cobalamin-dependent protein [Lachnospiraceae bacterium]
INPNVESMTGAVRSYNLLTGIDKNSVEYIEAYNQANGDIKKNVSGETKQMDIKQAILSGLKGETKRLTEKMLNEGAEALKIVDDMLIPALDVTGAEFEKGKIFLPQLIMSAEAAQAAFEAIKEDMVKKNNAPVSKGKIIIATVKGDIHDIGKNIVKVLLENYGYNVIDLGRDVPYETVVETAIKEDVKLVGLSALMTTTLVSMEKTIELLRKSGHECKVMVGGAVLTPDYALKIGADYYAKDAKESVDIAKKVLG